MSSLNVRRGMSCAVMICALSVSLPWLTACSSPGKKDDLAARLAVQEEVHEHMAAADKALKAGQLDQAMARLDAAIKADPASKAPWLKKAQIHFDAREYGQAITHAQEVLQRDLHDLTAKSILAVSGLRVGAAALEQLRHVNEVNGSTRSEAENVARLIREALGEPILVPAAAASASAPEPVKPAVAKRLPRAPLARNGAVATTAPSSQAGAATAPSAALPLKSAASAQAPASGRNNPFGALQ